MNYAIVGPVVYRTFPAQTSASALVGLLKSALVAAGWTSSAISGGFKLSTASPQGFAVAVNITDLGGPQVGVQMSGSVNGFLHKIAWEPDLNTIRPYGYQIVANPCNFFISRPGVASDPDGSAVSGGIPFVASNCGVGSGPTEVWYSFGDSANSPFFANMNPRIAIDTGGLGGFLLGSQEGCFNGTLYTFNDWSSPQILRYSSAQAGFGTTLWADGTDLLYEPLVAWPLTDGGDVEIRGQVYNAAVRSSSTAMDTTNSWDGYNWMAYTNSYQDGTLWLLTGQSELLVNYAY